MASTLEPVVPFDGEAILPLALIKHVTEVDADDRDDLLGIYRDAAIDWVERHTAKALQRREWTWTTDQFASPLRLPIGPVASITNVAYLSPVGVPGAVAANGWRVTGLAMYPAIGATWPSALIGEGAVTVTFVAGYENASLEAPALIAAVTMLTAHLFENREATTAGVTVSEVPFGVTALCGIRRQPVMA
jgi:uncharacterized phiE125 gp8 family phage protein